MRHLQARARDLRSMVNGTEAEELLLIISELAELRRRIERAGRPRMPAVRNRTVQTTEEAET